MKISIHIPSNSSRMKSDCTHHQAHRTNQLGDWEFCTHDIARMGTDVHKIHGWNCDNDLRTVTKSMPVSWDKKDIKGTFIYSPLNSTIWPMFWQSRALDGMFRIITLQYQKQHSNMSTCEHDFYLISVPTIGQVGLNLITNPALVQAILEGRCKWNKAELIWIGRLNKQNSKETDKAKSKKEVSVLVTFVKGRNPVD